MSELPEHLFKELTRLSELGDGFAGKRQYREALNQFNSAWELIPEPKQNWDASTWVLAAIGDCSFLGGFSKIGCEALEFALHCPNGLGNPFIHLRLGQCLLEQGLSDRAADHLCRAYALAGAGIFSDEAPKYFEFLKTRIAPPKSGVW